MTQSRDFDSARLNDFSRRFASALFDAYPEWKAFASIDNDDAINAGSLTVEVQPAQPRDIAWPLFVSTDNDEVTIGFDEYHAHFTPDGNEAETFADAMTFLAELLGERIAVISWWNGEKPLGASTMTTGAESIPPSFVRKAKSARIRSWAGTLDRDVDV